MPHRLYVLGSLLLRLQRYSDPTRDIQIRLQLAQRFTVEKSIFTTFLTVEAQALHLVCR